MPYDEKDEKIRSVSLKISKTISWLLEKSKSKAKTKDTNCVTPKDCRGYFQPFSQYETTRSPSANDMDDIRRLIRSLDNQQDDETHDLNDPITQRKFSKYSQNLSGIKNLDLTVPKEI